MRAVDGEGFESLLPTKRIHKSLVKMEHVRREARMVWVVRLDRRAILNDIVRRVC